MKRREWLAVVLIGVAIALAITVFSPFASSSPDGLERVAEDKGFLEQGKAPAFEVIPDYAVPGVGDERLATILSGVIGVVIVAALALGCGILLQSFARSRRGAAVDRVSDPSGGGAP